MRIRNDMETANKHAKKLDATKVKMIRLRAQQGATQGQLARDYGVTITQVGRVIRHEVWQEVPEALLPAADIEAQAARMMRLQEQVNALDAMAPTAATKVEPTQATPTVTPTPAFKVPDYLNFIKREDENK